MSKVDFNLKDKIAIVTGASRGIGEGISKTLAEYGAHVILASRKIDGLKRVQEEIEKNGGRASSIACNVGNMDHIENLFKEVRQTYKSLDILINNAATNPYFGDLLNAEEWAWNKTIDVNLKGHFFMTQHAAKLMKETGGGAIVYTSSVNAVRPAPLQGIYSITKAGIIAMMKAYAKELAPFNIRVNAILPGFTDTDFTAVFKENKNFLQTIISVIPISRMADPIEMAGAVLYLVSDAASYTTGSCITIDGGMLA